MNACDRNIDPAECDTEDCEIHESCSWCGGMSMNELLVGLTDGARICVLCIQEANAVGDWDPEMIDEEV